jgi:hypothetical protein
VQQNLSNNRGQESRRNHKTLHSLHNANLTCLPNLALKLAHVLEKSPYVAAHEAIASLFHGLITLAGGFLFDWLSDSEALSRIGLLTINPYVAIFGPAIILRTLAVPLSMAIQEPGGLEMEQDFLAEAVCCHCHRGQQSDCIATLMLHCGMKLN